MKFPDFYIVGAPKCGTTALYTYLGRHPRVFFPTFKEPNYFLTDLPKVRHYPTDERYLALYRKADPAALWGDASVWNLFSHRAADEIFERRPDAKIIIMLRQPVDAALSLHNHSIAMLIEDRDDFGDAWNVQDDRRAGRNLPFYCPHRELVIYQDVYLYAEQVQRYVDVFGHDQVKVVLFEDFVADTRGTYDALVKHIGLPPDTRPDLDFEPVNEALTLKSRVILDLLRAPPKPVEPLIMAGKRVANAMGVKPAGLLLKHFTKPVQKPTMSPDDRRAYAAAFETDLRRLEPIIGRDLTHWIHPPAPVGV